MECAKRTTQWLLLHISYVQQFFFFSCSDCWINPCFLQVILSSAFSQCCSVSLRCLLTLCVERTLDATCALLMLYSTDVVCTSHVSLKRSSHRRDSFIMVAEQALPSERLQVRIRARVEHPCWLFELVLRPERLLAGTRAGWWIRARSRHLEMAEEAMRVMYQQFTTALEGLTRQNTELQNELNQSRQQAANELASLRQEVRRAPLRGTQATGVGVDTRLLVKPSDFSGAQDAIPRLQKLMDDAAKAAAPIPNATIMCEERSRGVNPTLLDDAHDLQGRSAPHCVLDRKQRRSRSLATTDRSTSRR